MEPICHAQTTGYTTQIYRNSSAEKALSTPSAISEQAKNTLGVQVQFSSKAYELLELSIQTERHQSAVQQGGTLAPYKHGAIPLNGEGRGGDSQARATKTKPLDLNEEITPGDKGYQYLIYAVTWQPGFCKLKPETAGCDKPPQKFLTHGIWPYNDSTDQKTNRHPAFCNSSSSGLQSEEHELSSDVLEKIIQTPGIAELVTPDPRGMFKHEWEKHGTCSGKSINDYFNDIVKLRKAVEYDKPKFSAWIGRSVMFNDIRSAFPENASFRCFMEKDKQYLHEVFYLINPDGTPYLKDKNLQIGIPCNSQETFIVGAVETHAGQPLR